MELCEGNRRKKRVRFNEEVTNIVYTEPDEEGDEKENISFPMSTVMFHEGPDKPGILLNKTDEDGMSEVDENTSPLVFRLMNRRAPKSPGKPLKFRQIVTEELQDLANKKLFISDDDDQPSSLVDSTSSSNS